ncbi:MAG: PD40 domain-containing protein [Bacteroidaceae bacterium]|nr:PD40 domain-containing protein [Bacteroidaceae bacterium]
MSILRKVLPPLLLALALQPLRAQDAETMMRAYRFDEAARAYQSQIAEARRNGAPTATLEAHLAQAQRGARMLEATERVVFLDSVVMPANAVLSRLRLSAHAGRFTTPAAFFPGGLPRGFHDNGTAFANDFGDRLWLSQPDSSGLARLHSARLLGGSWTVPAPLPGLETAGDVQAFPFAMPDGQTLYFAAQSEESLGGYDIYVTRYDADAGRYLRPAHLGFPFNSTANDYLYCIDEAAGVGYFVTDRNQPPGTVCLYAFIPNTAHDIYLLTPENADSVRRAAVIASIDELGAQSDAARTARAQAKRALQAAAQATQRPVRIVIDDTHVYTDPSQLRNETARRIATEYVSRSCELSNAEAELDAARRQYADARHASFAQPDASLAARIRDLETRTANLRAATHRLAVNMRQAELRP